jgi:6-phosphogluconolactonase
MTLLSQLLSHSFRFAAAAVFVCALIASPAHAQSSCSSATFVYVNNNVDGANSVSAFCVGTGGALTAVAGSPFATGGSSSGFGYYGSNSITATVIGNYLFASDDESNDIAAFSINTTTGALTPVPGSPFAYGSEGESNPGGISLAVTPNGKFLYAGDSGNTVNETTTGDLWGFSIGANGALTSLQGSPFASFPSPGVPDGINVTRDGNYLAVALDGELAVAMYSVGANGALTVVEGSPFATGGSANGMAYAESNCSSNLLFGSQYSTGVASISVQTISSGALAPITSSPFTFGSSTGTDSNFGILSPNDEFLFVSNQLSNTIMSLAVASGGSLSQVAGSPFCNTSNTANCVPSSSVGPMVPIQLATNQAGTLLYVANANTSDDESIDNTVSAFSIGSNGALTLLSGSPFDSGAVGQPTLTVFPPKVCSSLNVAKSPAATSVTYGSPIGFTITGSNAASAQSAATNVALNDPLPGGSAVTWSVTNSTLGSCSISVIDDAGDQALNCAAGSLAPGASGTVNISGAGASVGAYPNTATISASAPNASSLTSSATVTVTQATPVFSGLTPSQTIPVGTASINLSGSISAPGPVYPPVEESVSITIDDITQTASIAQNGTFSTTFPTSKIPASDTPYTINYSYPGDNNFANASNTATTLTVTSGTVATLTMTLLGTGTGTVTDNLEKIDCSESNGTGQTGMCAAPYSNSPTVTLTAAPTSPSTFGGWGGACAAFGASTTCTVTLSSNVTVTANFVPPPTLVNLTFAVGPNSTQTATFACPSNTHPCTDPNAHQLELTTNVSSAFGVTVMSTEVPPLQADGLCEVGNTVNNDFDCRFVTFFGDGLDPAGDTIVPHCDPYANGNCVHYLVYAGTPGTEPPPSSYSGGVYWSIRWNNSSYVPGSYWTGSIPQLYDDPDYAPFPNSAVGTSCSTPMTINGVPQSYFCQFEYNITTFYNPIEPVDSGIGGSTKQFNDVVVAFPPTTEGSGTVVSPPPVPTAPTVSGACITGCSSTSSTIAFAINTGGSFLLTVTGYPPPAITESGALPNGITFKSLTGILGGTPTSGVNGSFPISFTATNGVGSVTLNYIVTVSQLAFSPSTVNFGDTFPSFPVARTFTITNGGATPVHFIKFSITPIAGDDSAGFLYFSLCPDILPPGKSCTLLFGLTPDSNFTKTHAANFVITDNAAGSPQVVPLVATVLPASLSTFNLNFGNQKTGSTSPARSATLKNIGTTAFTLPALGITGPFAFAPTNTCTSGKSLAPGATCAISVNFKPVSKGLAIGSVTITENPFIILTGNGD